MSNLHPLPVIINGSLYVDDQPAQASTLSVAKQIDRKRVGLDLVVDELGSMTV